VHIRRIAGVSSIFVILVGAGGCGHVAFRGSHRQSYGAFLQTSAKAAFTLPYGYGPVTSLVGDPRGSGVWFWDSTKFHLSIFRVGSRGTTKSWTVLRKANEFQAISGFAVTSTGVVWLGINSTLTRLESTSGTVRTWKIPAPVDNRVAESYLPAELKGQHLVQGIAVAPNGKEVAIAMTNSNSVELFDESSGKFGQVAMPTVSEEPLSVAYSSNGTLGIGLANFRTHKEDAALIIRNGGTGTRTVVRVADSSSITSDGTSKFILGSSRPYLVSTAGSASPIIAPRETLTDHSGPSIDVMPRGNAT
jgi:hypothetical protein